MSAPSDECYRLMLRLRAVRRFLSDPLPGEAVEQILEAARWTGSSKNTQPWAFVLVRDDTQRQRLSDCGHFSGPIRNAPVTVVLIRRPGGGEFDIGRLAQNLMLAAAALGIGSCPVTLHDEDCARRVLGVPEDHGCRFAVALGYEDEEAERMARRRARSSFQTGRQPLPDLVFDDSFAVD